MSRDRPNKFFHAGLFYRNLLSVVMIAAITMAMVLLLWRSPIAQHYIPLLWVIGLFVFLAFIGIIIVFRQSRSELYAFSRYFAQDQTAALVITPKGQILSTNRAFDEIYGADAVDFIATFGPKISNAANLLFRMQSVAMRLGHTSEKMTVDGVETEFNVTSLPQKRLLMRLRSLEEAYQVDTALPIKKITITRDGIVTPPDGMFDGATGLLGADTRVWSEVYGNLDAIHVPKLVENGHAPNLVVPLTRPSLGKGDQDFLIVPAPQEAASIQKMDRNLFDAIPVPLIQLDFDGRILSANIAALGIIETPLTEGVAFDTVFSSTQSTTPTAFQRLKQTPEQQFTEFLRLRKSEDSVILQAVFRHITVEQTDIVLVALADATELKSLEAQFVQSQKMQAIGQLAGGVAHDFNNLLTAISGHCDLLLLRHDSRSADFADLMQIHQNTNRAASLVGQLLAFSRKQNLQLEGVNIRETLSDLTHLLNRLVGEKIQLSFVHDPNLRAVWADKRQLEQVLMNLVVNARDAMPSGGTIAIRTFQKKFTKAWERDGAKIQTGEYVLIEVEDQGHGIPVDKLRKIFEPFVTTKKVGDGTGLGLSTAYGIVKQSNGFLFVDSKVNMGSTFSIYLPAKDAPKSIPTVTELVESPTSSISEGTVLLVEDEAPVRAFASRALQLKGFDVLEADCGESALKLLEDKQLAVDIFVTDVVMPGLDGPGWVTQALKDRPNAQVVFVSGYAEDSFGDKQAQIKNSVFLPKPFSLSDLTNTVAARLHHRAADA